MCGSHILIRAVLTAHLSRGANSAPQASWVDFGEGRRRGKVGKGKGRGRKMGGKREENGMEGKGKGTNGSKRGKKGREEFFVQL